MEVLFFNNKIYNTYTHLCYISYIICLLLTAADACRIVARNENSVTDFRLRSSVCSFFRLRKNDELAESSARQFKINFTGARH